MKPNWMFIGAGCGFLSVALGAFGSHGLRDVLDPAAMQTWETATRYLQIHSIALVLTGFWHQYSTNINAYRAGFWFLTGMLLFSGSLMVVAISGIRWIGAITPLGGISFLIGWGLLAWSTLKSK